MSRLALAALLLALVLATLLSSCGGGGEGSDSTARTVSTPTENLSPAARLRREEADYYGFGSTPTPAQRAQIIAATRSYFAAFAAHDYKVACSLLSRAARASLAALTATPGQGCGVGLRASIPARPSPRAPRLTPGSGRSASRAPPPISITSPATTSPCSNSAVRGAPGDHSPSPALSSPPPIRSASNDHCVTI